MRTGMCADVCIDMRAGTCVGMRTHSCLGMCADMCVDMSLAWEEDKHTTGFEYAHRLPMHFFVFLYDIVIAYIVMAHRLPMHFGII